MHLATTDALAVGLDMQADNLQHYTIAGPGRLQHVACMDEVLIARNAIK